MKILAVADDPDKRYYNFYKPGCLNQFSLILACGDLSRAYLEFLVTMARCPVVYVHGNHDDAFSRNPPEGCICAEDTVVKVQGVRILGLGGSNRYKPDGLFMYTEKEMHRRYRKVRRFIRRNKGFDILLTHAPAYGINDFNTITHRGFETFSEIIDTHRPKFFVHGHIHKNYGANIPTFTQHGETMIVNACESCIIEFDGGEEIAAASPLSIRQ